MNEDEKEILQWKINRDTSLLENGLERKSMTEARLDGRDWTDEMIYAFEKGIVAGLKWVRDDMQICIQTNKEAIALQKSETDIK